MPWQVTFHPDPAVVELNYDGMVSPGELGESVAAVIALSERHGCAHFLTDGTRMQGGHSMLDLYAQMEQILKSPFTAPFREALVMPPGAPAEVVENMDFWASGLRLRGFDVEIFLDRSLALRWLAKP